MIRSIPTQAQFHMSGAAAVAEGIAAKDNNNLYRTSSFFHDKQRYRAFCAFYAVMRVVDDRIDSLPFRGELTPAERAHEHNVVENWRRAVAACRQGQWPAHEPNPEQALGHPQATDLLIAMTDAFRRFPVSLGLWHNFFDAMHHDIERARFATFQEFLQYAEGATVAPTTIYLFLLTAQIQADGTYRPPPNFDLTGCGRALGRFAYLGHILRDLPEDLRSGDEGVLFLAADDMQHFQLTERTLFADLAAGRSGTELRLLTAELVQRARCFLVEGQRYLKALDDDIPPDCAFILQLIIAIYKAVLDKIARFGNDPLSPQIRLTDDEKGHIVLETAQLVEYN